MNTEWLDARAVAALLGIDFGRVNRLAADGLVRVRTPAAAAMFNGSDVATLARGEVPEHARAKLTN